jgi:hypothetical protein
VRFETLNLNTGQTLPVNRQTAPTAASNYRESGFVQLAISRHPEGS